MNSLKRCYGALSPRAKPRLMKRCHKGTGETYQFQSPMPDSAMARVSRFIRNWKLTRHSDWPRPDKDDLPMYVCTYSTLEEHEKPIDYVVM